MKLRKVKTVMALGTLIQKESKKYNVKLTMNESCSLAKEMVRVHNSGVMKHDLNFLIKGKDELKDTEKLFVATNILNTILGDYNYPLWFCKSRRMLNRIPYNGK